MKEPDENLLDRHFRQQLLKYVPVFKQKACRTDVAMIEYWLQVYKAAPKQQKWARNSLMLLMYGQLKEIGRLKVPFTDMRNMGRDLNEILDGYEGLPIISRNRSTTTIILPRTREQYSQSNLINAIEGTKFERNKEICESRSRCSLSTGGESLQTLYETFNSHVCFRRKSQTETQSEKKSAYGTPKMARGAPLSPIPEARSSREFWGQSSCSADLRDKESATTAKGSHCTCTVSLGKSKCEGHVASVGQTADKACQGSPREATRCEAIDAELMYLRRRNKQLRRECLIYYNRKGDLRRSPKYPKSTVQRLGFLVGAYRAHYHFTRWQHQSNHPIYFHQEYDRVNGWRTYRRILLIKSVPRSRLRQGLDGKRQRLLQRMCRILRLKNVCSRLGIGQMSGQELQNLLMQLEDKYLALANNLQCEPKAVRKH